MHVIKFCLLLLTRPLSSISEIRLFDFITSHEKIVLLVKPYNLIKYEKDSEQETNKLNAKTQ